jgi:predicted nucleic acid-binding protein
MSRSALLDTNALIYFLTGHPVELARKASLFFASAARGELELVLTMLTIAEAVWVLTSSKGLPRAAISRSLLDIVQADGVSCEDKAIAHEALRCFGTTKVDFVDAYLAARARRDGLPIASFDRDFDRLDVERIKPGK